MEEPMTAGDKEAEKTPYETLDEAHLLSVLTNLRFSQEKEAIVEGQEFMPPVKKREPPGNFGQPGLSSDKPL